MESNKTHLEKDSPVWQKAQEFLERQTSLYEDLGSIMASSTNKIPTGLYQDDEEATTHRIDQGSFRHFVIYVRTVLSRSPRTILRQALQNAYENLSEWQELGRLLQSSRTTNHSNCHPAFSDACEMARVMEGLSKGKCYKKLETLRQQLDREESCDKDEQYSRMHERIRNGLKRKWKRTPTTQELQQAVESAISKQEERTNRLQEQVVRLEEELNTDSEYSTFCKASQLWKQSGMDTIWRNYKTVDLAISRSRNRRGSQFESNCCQLIFAMIVLRLLKNGKNCTELLQRNDFAYQRNVHWWQRQQAVGELDLVVYHKGHVVAVCEMKSSCFEIAAGPRQHETKRAMMSKEQTEDECWAIGPTADKAIVVSSPIPLFLATVLPRTGEKECWQIGVEPMIVNAVGEGIRAQGRFVVHSSNDDICEPLLPMLREESFRLEEAMRYLENIPSSLDDCGGHDDNDLDYDLVKAFVLKKLGVDKEDSRLEAPLGCLKRFGPDKVLVLPRSLLSSS